jgi:hypothetical protein
MATHILRSMRLQTKIGIGLVSVEDKVTRRIPARRIPDHFLNCGINDPLGKNRSAS